MKKLILNRDIYSNYSIEKTMQAYRNHAVMTVYYDACYATVSFLQCKYDSDQTIKEFENYMIGVENAKHGVSV